MPYIPHTDPQRADMLRQIGMKREDLFADIPESLRASSFDLPEALSEQEVATVMRDHALSCGTCLPCFLGGGAYDHYQPAAVDALISRSEFYTAYTPYQPEASQGTLQAIYEYQSAMCRLTGLEVSNASLYDGGTALFEGILVAMRLKRRSRVVIDSSVNAFYRRMLATYTASLEAEIVTVDCAEGKANRQAIADAVDDKTAAVVVASPTFFGRVDDVSDVADLAHDAGALLICSTYPTALGICKTPGEMNADIAVGEAQCLGLPLAFGGPWLGFITATKKCMRRMPGRMAGKTLDADGKEGFVLTLQAREQHIRREKATSNICTNQGLCALQAVVYLSLLGKTGFKQLAEVCASKAAYAAGKLSKVPGVELRFGPDGFFNEFVLDLPRKADEVAGDLLKKGLAGGIPLGRFYPDMPNSLLTAVTERRTKDDIDALAKALEDVL
jgi:glycine dehydrogenase subunit 1